MNPRHPAPKRRRNRFSIEKQSFPALPVPEKILSGALVSTVSARSGSRYGQTCGQKIAPGDRQNFDPRERSYGNSVETESQDVFSLSRSESAPLKQRIMRPGYAAKYATDL